MSDRKFPDDIKPAAQLEDKGKLTTSELVAMAWDDDTSFDQIKTQSGLSEAEIIKIMRRHMKPSSFRMWRKRVSGRASKHASRLNENP
ncbi:MAG: TIGR03643 family protein [Maricaulaceae bacterium]